MHRLYGGVAMLPDCWYFLSTAVGSVAFSKLLVCLLQRRFQLLTFLVTSLFYALFDYSLSQLGYSLSKLLALFDSQKFLASFELFLNIPGVDYSEVIVRQYSVS